MLAHCVYFWTDDLSDEDRQKFEEGLRSLLEIDVVEDGFIGTPAATKKRDVIDDSYDYALILWFAGIEPEAAYQEHPAHLEFVNNCSSYWNRVVVYNASEV